MKLTFDQIVSITLGADEIKNGSEGMEFYRFTKEERDLYIGRPGTGLYAKSFSSSGIQFRFRTDSTVLSLKGETAAASSRSFFGFDLYLDGVYTASGNNFSHLQAVSLSEALSFGKFSYDFSLGKGEKEVLLYFPWSAVVKLSEVSLSDGACIMPVKPKMTLLAYGDSITQGYDALYPSGSYISRIARRLDAQVFNKAIGGDTFFPELVDAPHESTPDLITVAYGTNDWSFRTFEEFSKNCFDFYARLSRRYPKVPILALTPIWRKGYEAEKECGPFEGIAKTITEACKNIPNARVIRGFDFVPHNSGFFSDGYLHPNDIGFSHYADSLFPELEKALKIF